MSDFEMVPVAPNTTGNIFFCIHVLCIYIVRGVYFKNSSTYLIVTFVSPEIAPSVYIHSSFRYHDL